MDAPSPPARRALFFGLYLTEGGPIGLLWWALPAHLRLLGLPVDSITLLTSLLVLPWALKFLWAPVIDASTARGVPLRRWIGGAQLAMASTLLPLLWLDPAAEFPLLVVSLVAHAISASTQDAAIDAYAIRTVQPGDRGSINAFMQAGMLVGRGVFGGSTLIVIEALGFGGAVSILALTLAGSALFVLAAAPAAGHAATARRSSLGATLRRARDVVRDPGSRDGFVVALLAGAGFEGVGALAGPFLVDRGYDPVVIGMFFALGTTPAMLAGVFLGGWRADRSSRAAVARAGVLAMAGVIGALAVADSLAGPADPLRIALLVVLYAGIGYFTAGSYALFMDLTDPRIGATQFSAYMAATNLCEATSAFASGRAVAMVGYPLGFLFLTGASLLSLPALRRIQIRQHGAQGSSPTAQASE